MSTIFYYIFLGITRIFHFIPLKWLYGLSDVFYFFVCKIIGYRKNVVRTNLLNAFPDKSEQERKEIETKFYHYLCDTFVETLYFAHMSKKEILERVDYSETAIINKYIEDGRAVIASLGHHNNWEWMCSFGYCIPCKYYVIYKPLHSKIIDRFYRRLRSRTESTPVKKNDIFRTLIGDYRDGKASISGFLNDQTPKKNEIQYWTTFLNQDTPILLGTEKIAKKTNSVVVGIHMQRVKRGYFKVSAKLLTDSPKEEEIFAITEKHTRFLEEIIQKEPAYWLWSHRRWKHRKETSDNKVTKTEKKG